MSKTAESAQRAAVRESKEKQRADMVGLLYPHVMRLADAGPLRAAFERAGRVYFSPPAVRLAYDEFHKLSADRRADLLDGWVWPKQLRLDMTSLRIPAMKISSGPESSHLTTVEYAVQDVNSAEVCVTIPAGTTREHVADALCRALAIVADSWDELPGRCDTNAVVGYEIGIKKGEVPSTQFTARIETRNGEKARETTPAGA